MGMAAMNVCSLLLHGVLKDGESLYDQASILLFGRRCLLFNIRLLKGAD